MTYLLGLEPYAAIPGMSSLNCVGAGARSIVGCGMLKRIHELKKSFNLIYGCSGGSMNATLYAQGDIDLLEWLWLTIKNKDVRNLDVKGIMSGKPGVYDFSPLHKTLLKYVDPAKLSKSKAQVYISVTSLNKNEGVLYDLKRLPGDLHPADVLLSSASILVLVKPNMLGDEVTYDGGLANNYCVAEAASRGVSEITILHPNTPEIDTKIDSLMDAFEVVTTIPMWSNYLHQKAALDMMEDPKPKLIELIPKFPVPGSLFDFDFKDIDRKSLIRLGYEIAVETLG